LREKCPARRRASERNLQKVVPHAKQNTPARRWAFGPGLDSLLGRLKAFPGEQHGQEESGKEESGEEGDEKESTVTFACARRKPQP
jgi:hypothetical protein